MRKATPYDEQLVVDLITESFQSNPSVLSAVKNDNKKNTRIRELARYAFRTAITRNGVYLSSNTDGFAICYQYNKKKNSFIDYLNQIRLILKSVGINKVPSILHRESYINKVRPKSGNYLYFWFYGVNNLGKGGPSANELKDAVFQESEDKQLPIYLETSVAKNKRVYERYGFQVYHTWNNEKEGITLWFMKREPKNKLN